MRAIEGASESDLKVAAREDTSRAQRLIAKTIEQARIRNLTANSLAEITAELAEELWGKYPIALPVVYLWGYLFRATTDERRFRVAREEAKDLFPISVVRLMRKAQLHTSRVSLVESSIALIGAVFENESEKVASLDLFSSTLRTNGYPKMGNAIEHFLRVRELR